MSHLFQELWHLWHDTIMSRFFTALCWLRELPYSKLSPTARLAPSFLCKKMCSILHTLHPAELYAEEFAEHETAWYIKSWAGLTSNLGNL